MNTIIDVIETLFIVSLVTGYLLALFAMPLIILPVTLFILMYPKKEA